MLCKRNFVVVVLVWILCFLQQRLRPGGHSSPKTFGEPTVGGGEPYCIPSVNWQMAFQLVVGMCLTAKFYNCLKVKFRFFASHLGPVFLREYAFIS